MKKFRTIIAAVLVLALALAAIPAFAEGAKTAPAEVNGSTFSNEHISFTVADDARLSAYTTASGERMIYGASNNHGNTSYTTISINGSRVAYGENLTVAPAFNGNTNYSAQNYNGVMVEQRLTPVRNDAGHESIVEWRYTYTNNTSSVQNVGCRIMLDTCLDDNDGAPFRLPNVDSITYERELTSNIPDYWFTYDGDFVVQGSFGYDNVKPDTLQFGAWIDKTGWIITNEFGMYLTNWDYSVDTGHQFEDAAVSATWHEEALQPGETREYVMYYGVGEVEHIVVEDGRLALDLNGEHSVTINDAKDGYLPTPVTLMGILTNVANGDAVNSYERIELPAGLTLVGEANVNAGTIAPGGEYQHTWNYTIDEFVPYDRTFTIRVYFGCDGQDEAYGEWTLYVPGIELVPPTIDALRAELRNRTPNDSKADLRFVFQVNFNDGFVNYLGTTYGPGVVFEITHFYTVLNVQGRLATVEGNNIFEMFNDNYTFTAVLKGMRPTNFGVKVGATGYLEYVNVNTGVEGGDNTEDQIFVYSVDDLL